MEVTSPDLLPGPVSRINIIQAVQSSLVLVPVMSYCLYKMGNLEVKKEQFEELAQAWFKDTLDLLRFLRVMHGVVQKEFFNTKKTAFYSPDIDQKLKALEHEAKILTPVVIHFGKDARSIKNILKQLSSIADRILKDISNYDLVQFLGSSNRTEECIEKTRKGSSDQSVLRFMNGEDF